jgi:hypothetical protein
VEVPHQPPPATEVELRSRRTRRLLHEWGKPFSPIGPLLLGSSERHQGRRSRPSYFPED